MIEESMPFFFSFSSLDRFPRLCRGPIHTLDLTTYSDIVELALICLPMRSPHA